MPGIGKTAKVLEKYDYVEVMLASSMVEEDIAGIPYREGFYDLRTIPLAIKNLQDAANEGKTTALFLDELDKARRSVADTLLTLVANRKIGRTELPSNTVIIAAANPPEWGGGDGISDAMLSRFSVIPVEPNIKEWVLWAKSFYKDNLNIVGDIINAIDCGEILIADISGEGLNKRITCPRTISLALNYVISQETNIEPIVKGLLTPSTASQFLNIFNKSDTSLSKKAAIVRSAAKEKLFKPIRI